MAERLYEVLHGVTLEDGVTRREGTLRLDPSHEDTQNFLSYGAIRLVPEGPKPEESTGEAGPAASEAATEHPSMAPDPVPSATPAAIKRAEELGVDLDAVTATGRDGRITEADVERSARGS